MGGGLEALPGLRAPLTRGKGVCRDGAPGAEDPASTLSGAWARGVGLGASAAPGGTGGLGAGFTGKVTGFQGHSERPRLNGSVCSESEVVPSRQTSAGGQAAPLRRGPHGSPPGGLRQAPGRLRTLAGRHDTAKSRAGPSGHLKEGIVKVGRLWWPC